MNSLIYGDRYIETSHFERAGDILLDRLKTSDATDLYPIVIALKELYNSNGVECSSIEMDEVSANPNEKRHWKSI